MTTAKVSNSDELLTELKGISERRESKCVFLHKYVINTLKLYLGYEYDPQKNNYIIQIPRSDKHGAAAIHYLDDDGSDYHKLVDVESLEFKLQGLNKVSSREVLAVELDRSF